ncbi:hypothetical protein OG809_03610 [Kribbella soli]|jgi:hypothetical protein
MAVTPKGRLLVAWAKALGVDNDLDAIVELHRVMNQLDDARSVLQKANRLLVNAPDPDAARGCVLAMGSLERAGAELLTVERRFHKHERGRG